MSDSVVGRIAVLLVLLAALVLAVVNVLMKGVIGLAVFEAVDLPLLLLLPEFHDDYRQVIGSIYGLFWALLMAGIFIVAINRRVPEKWRGSPLLYRTGLLAVSAVAMSVVLALPFHLYGLWMTHTEYGV